MRVVKVTEFNNSNRLMTTSKSLTDWFGQLGLTRVGAYLALDGAGQLVNSDSGPQGLVAAIHWEQKL